MIIGQNDGRGGDGMQSHKNGQILLMPENIMCVCVCSELRPRTKMRGNEVKVKVHFTIDFFPSSPSGQLWTFCHRRLSFHSFISEETFC